MPFTFFYVHFTAAVTSESFASAFRPQRDQLVSLNKQWSESARFIKALLNKPDFHNSKTGLVTWPVPAPRGVAAGRSTADRRTKPNSTPPRIELPFLVRQNERESVAIIARMSTEPNTVLALDQAGPRPLLRFQVAFGCDQYSGSVRQSNLVTN
jgi:hypothetical protein